VRVLDSRLDRDWLRRLFLWALIGGGGGWWRGRKKSPLLKQNISKETMISCIGLPSPLNFFWCFQSFNKKLRKVKQFCKIAQDVTSNAKIMTRAEFWIFTLHSPRCQTSVHCPRHLQAHNTCSYWENFRKTVLLPQNLWNNGLRKLSLPIKWAILPIVVNASDHS